MDLVWLCSGSSGAVAPLEICAPLRLLDPLRAMVGNLVRVCCRAIWANVVAAGSSAVISTIISSKLYFFAAV